MMRHESHEAPFGLSEGDWLLLNFTVAASPVPGYEIIRTLSEGGMGRVYLAVDNSIYEPIALKVLSAAYQSNPAVLEQFKHELKLARKVRHRNVVASFHLGQSDGQSYLTQENIDSENLSAFMERRGTLDEAEALRLLRQVLRGLKAAHDLGIVRKISQKVCVMKAR